MMTNDQLERCNETELLQIIRDRGSGTLRRGIPREALLQIAKGTVAVAPEYFAGTYHSRNKLQGFIVEHWAQCANQLPGCTGECSRFPCTEAKHVLCYSGGRDAVQL
jgi:hypothetical protein